jgi:hypothetical protein
MTDVTPKLVTLRPAKAIAAHEMIDPPVSTSERDGFVAETAVRLDQLQSGHRALTRQIEDLADRVARIEEVAGQDHRLHGFQQSQRRAKEEKLDDVARICRDLKARLDRIEARSDGNYHAYNSFEAISRKLAELEPGEKSWRKRPLLLGSALLIAISLGSALRIALTQF